MNIKYININSGNNYIKLNFPNEINISFDKIFKYKKKLNIEILNFVIVKKKCYKRIFKKQNIKI